MATPQETRHVAGRHTRLHVLALGSVLAIAVGLGVVCPVGANVSDASPSSLRVPVGDFLVGDRLGHLRVVDGRGKLVRRVPRFLAGPAIQGIELTSDRRHAFVSILKSERPARLYVVDLATGGKLAVANGISPALSPDRRRLAYISTWVRAGIIYRTTLVVRDLRTGRRHAIPLGPRVPLGTPPELVINWSPDGRAVAVFDGSRIRLVDVATASDVSSQPGVTGDAAGSSSRTPSLAPVFLDAHTLVVLADCCVGKQHLLAIDLRSGARTPFADLSSPTESVRRLGRGLLLTVTALDELAVVSSGHFRVIAKSITAAAG